MQMWLTGKYREVVENQLLVYTESMSDESGNVLSPEALGMPAGHPTTTEVRVELEYVGGRTKMVMSHAGVPSDSPGATDGRWRSASSPPTSKHTLTDSAPREGLSLLPTDDPYAQA
jgi:uncharacterized protein YndB with AHSA1/START domain